jgi:exportin-2 (importin alpha re-exporter)
MPPKDRKLAAVGLTRMLTQSAFMLQEPSVRAWYASDRIVSVSLL